MKTLIHILCIAGLLMTFHNTANSQNSALHKAFNPAVTQLDYANQIAKQIDRSMDRMDKSSLQKKNLPTHESRAQSIMINQNTYYSYKYKRSTSGSMARIKKGAVIGALVGFTAGIIAGKKSTEGKEDLASVALSPFVIMMSGGIGAGIGTFAGGATAGLSLLVF